MRKEYNPFPKAKKTKRIAQFFTGGLDSTYLLYYNLKVGHSVTPHYVEIANNGNKSKIERQQLVKIHAVLQKEFPNQLNDPKMITKTEIWKGYDSGLKFAQIPIWLFATNYVDQDYFDEIQMGYVSNDDATPFATNMIKTYNSMTWMMYENYNRPKLTFPLLTFHKYEMLRVLPTNLKELIYSCENPNVSDDFQFHNEDSTSWYGNRYSLFLDHKDKFYIFEPCGECVPCSKILNDQHLFDMYSTHQPIFKVLDIHNTINQYNRLMDRTQWNDDTKRLVNEKFERDNKLKGSDLWTAVQHPKEDDEIEKEMIGIDMDVDKELLKETDVVLSINKSETDVKNTDSVADQYLWKQGVLNCDSSRNDMAKGMVR